MASLHRAWETWLLDHEVQCGAAPCNGFVSDIVSCCPIWERPRHQRGCDPEATSHHSILWHAVGLVLVLTGITEMRTLQDMRADRVGRARRHHPSLGRCGGLEVPRQHTTSRTKRICIVSLVGTTVWLRAPAAAGPREARATTLLQGGEISTGSHANEGTLAGVLNWCVGVWPQLINRSWPSRGPSRWASRVVPTSVSSARNIGGLGAVDSVSTVIIPRIGGEAADNKTTFLPFPDEPVGTAPGTVEARMVNTPWEID